MQLPDSTIQFTEGKLEFKARDIESPFIRKNNKTLKETLDHHRYLKLRDTTMTVYSKYLDWKLGDFLSQLKDKGDIHYKKFLNPYGDLKYCEFVLVEHLDKKGLYCYYEGNELVYVGRCLDNFKKRLNNGYGKIAPKNCYKDGQSTNCHINALINSASDIRFGIYDMTGDSNNKIKQLEEEILNKHPLAWNIQLQRIHRSK